MIEINYLAVLVAALSSLVIGGLWYGPVFGKKWMALAGISPEGMASMKLTPIQAMIGGFVVGLFTAYVLAHAIALFLSVFPMMGSDVWMTGVLFGFFAWLGFAVPMTAGAFLWEGKSWKLWGLNAAYYLVSYSVMGVILALW